MFKPLKSPAFVPLFLLSASILSAGTNAIADQQQSAVAASNCFQGASAGYVRPRLAVGIAGHSVATRNLKIREQPGFDRQIAGLLAPGDTFQVVEGPECRDSYVWWKIHHDQVEGWVGEANPATSKYLLAPDNK